MKDERPTFRGLLALAAPLVASHAGNQMMSVVDTAMVGRLGSAELAGVGIANGLYFTITLVGLGCVLGMDAPAAQAVGAKEHVRARRILWQGLWVALACAFPLCLLVFFAPGILPLFGVEPEICRHARDYLWGRVPNVFPFLFTVAVRSFLQANGRTTPMIVATIVGNVVNFIGNGLLMWGDDALSRVGLPRVGLPALGVVGAAISTTISSTLMMSVLIVSARRVEAPEDPLRRKLDPDLARTIFRLGLPIGLQLLAEVGVFSLVAVLTGRLGKEAASAHQIAIQLASFSFCVTIGIASATAVLVGHSIGRARTGDARHAGLLGLATSAIFMSCSGVVFLIHPELLARILTDKPEVIAASLPLIQIAGFFALSDGTQATASGALRGAGDARVPLIANVIGHYAIGFPIAWILGFGLGLGTKGLWWGLSAGLTAVAIGLTARFLAITRREIARV
jgi:MATE family multidrug resistance protein